MILRFAAFFAIIGAVFVLYYVGTPKYFEVSKNVDIISTPDKVFSLIRNSSDWFKWSQFAKNKMGTYEVVSEIPEKEFIIDLTYLKPVRQTLRYTFEIIAKDQNTTRLKVSCKGNLDVTSKFLYQVLNIPKLINEQVGQEIDELKRLAENKE